MEISLETMIIEYRMKRELNQVELNCIADSFAYLYVFISYLCCSEIFREDVNVSMKLGIKGNFEIIPKLCLYFTSGDIQYYHEV